MAFCDQCGEQLNEGAKFCGKCGTQVGDVTPEQNTPTASSCNQCGAPLEEGEAFCANCGAKVGAMDEVVNPVIETSPVISMDSEKTGYGVEQINHVASTPPNNAVPNVSGGKKPVEQGKGGALKGFVYFIIFILLIVWLVWKKSPLDLLNDLLRLL
ncbi:MAG: zinc ribbon domain-containing protein [Treponema sp.]|jgi:RNA polymerase subunit RPABC4/transcription elongation factor Spt4|nr:zinc ribbon domain-containing protein [Treponema sp.]